jgi:GTPase
MSSEVDVSSFYLEPENDEGNHEYKYKLTGLTSDEIETKSGQMNYRLEEGNGEAIYEIGVSDNGCPLGLIEANFEETLQTIYKMAEIINATVQVVEKSESPVSLSNPDYRKIYAKCHRLNIKDMTNEQISEKRYVGELLVRRNNTNANQYISVQITVAGSADAGKCLAKGTKILMADSRICAVENIKEGNMVVETSIV